MTENDPYELAHQIDRLMRRMNAGAQAKVPLFDSDRIGPIGGMILLTVAELQPTTMQHLATTMARDKAQLSRTITMLERRELLTKSANAEDARSQLLTLTEKGARFVTQIKATLSGVLDEILAPLNTQERAEMLRLLSKT